MTFDDSNQVLRQHGFELGNPRATLFPVYKVMLEERKRFSESLAQSAGCSTSVASDILVVNVNVAIFGIKHVRGCVRLTEEHGVDGAASTIGGCARRDHQQTGAFCGAWLE